MVQTSETDVLSYFNGRAEEGPLTVCLFFAIVLIGTEQTDAGKMFELLRLEEVGGPQQLLAAVQSVSARRDASRFEMSTFSSSAVSEKCSASAMTTK